MNCRKLITVALASALVCALALPVWAAGPETAPGPQKPVVGQNVNFDISPPFREMARAHQLREKAAGGPPVAIIHRAPGERPPRPEVTAPDVARQTLDRPIEAAALTPAPALSFDGLSDDDNANVVGFRIVPPDTNGDVGPNHFVQWVNVILAVYDKAGNMVLGPVAGNSIWNGFGGPCEANNDGDPIVIYDHLADRWQISQFSINEGIQCVAVSTTGDPTGSYYRYAFPVTPGGNNDYPKLGLFTDGAGQSSYTFTMRDFIGNSFETSVGAFDRDAMLVGNPSVSFVKFANPCAGGNCVDGVQPPHLEGPAPPAGTCADFFVAWDDQSEGPFTGGVDGYRNYQLCVDWNNPGNSTFGERTIAASLTGFNRDLCGFFQRACIPQPRRGGGERLDPFDEATMYRAQFRSFGSHNSVVINHSVDADGSDLAGVRWAELRQTTQNGLWTVYQEGTYAPDAENRWMGSIAQDKNGNITIGYSVSSTNTFPSIRYTSRMAGDPLGTMTGGEVSCVEGTGSQTGSSNRWGDYMTISVDPVDDCTFWLTSEYYQTTGSFNFKTRVCKYAMSDCQASGPCGDGTCNPLDGEDCTTCPADCPSGTNASCGNGVCEASDGEDCTTCPADCNGVQGGKPSSRFCCGNGGSNPVGCSDSRCTTGGFSCTEVPVGNFCCGDGQCDTGEVGLCPADGC